MLFLLGVIAFLQMTLIPGYITVKYLRIPLESKLQAVIYTFAVSLLMNYLLVYLLTVLKTYKPLTIYIVLALELLLLIFINRLHRLTQILAAKTREDTQRTMKEKVEVEEAASLGQVFNACGEAHATMQPCSHATEKSCNSVSSVLSVAKKLFVPLCLGALVAIVIVVLAKFLYIFISQLGEPFRLNDAVLGWNEFALDWFQKRLPTDTWFYPQLLPANWSLAYTIMQNPDIQAAARSIMPLFSIFTALLFLDLGLRKKRAVYLWGLIFYGIMVFYLYPPVYIVDGHMDIPSAFFAFLAFYVLHLHHADSPPPLKHLVLAVTFASIAAVTKQAGLFILIVILAWVTRYFFKARRSLARDTFFKTAAVILLAVTVIALSWYLYRVARIYMGNESSGIHTVTQEVHKNRTYIERLEFGFNRIKFAANRKESGAVYVYAALILLGFSLFTRRSRNVTLFIVIPYTLIWGLFYSYDYRNLTLAVPFMAFSMAMGAGWVFDTLAKKPLFRRLVFFRQPVLKKQQPVPAREYPQPKRSVDQWLRLSFLSLAGFLIPVLILLNFTLLKPEKLINHQLAKQRLIGFPQLNKRLYDYYEKNGFKGKVFSKYPYFKHLPVLRDYWTPNREDPGVRYIIETFKRPRQDIVIAVKQKLKSGEYKLLFSHGQYQFIEIVPSATREPFWKRVPWTLPKLLLIEVFGNPKPFFQKGFWPPEA